jgi:NAD(P)-dependent dehydrogenase (short-subunit alcohol dehydrogenase family)
MRDPASWMAATSACARAWLGAFRGWRRAGTPALAGRRMRVEAMTRPLYHARMARIVVLGGQGYLGGRAVAALRAAGADVHVASRSSARVVDVARPETYGALADADVVVDLVDTVAHPPDALLAWCVAQGKVVLEATSDSRTVERLAAATWPGPGALVLGCGIFTGLSNLLARDGVEACPGGAARLTLGIASSPLSGAGQGTIAMMVDALDAPVVRYAAGVRHVRDTVEVGPRVDFGVNGRPELRATLRIALAEAMMIHRSTAVPTVDVYFAPSPALLVPAFAVIPGWLARRRWFQAFMRGYFTVLRRGLLRNRASPVTLVAEAVGPAGAARRVLSTEDGMLAGGYAIAALAMAVAARDPRPRGLVFIDQVCGLEAIVAALRAIPGAPGVVVSGRA